MYPKLMMCPQVVFEPPKFFFPRTPEAESNVPRKDLAPDLCELKRRLRHWTTQRWCQNSY